MNTPSARTRRIILFSTGPVAVVVAGLLIWQLSSAAFTAQTQNPGNNWATGSVLLTDDDMGAAAFQITNVIPGATGTHCILVTSQSTVPGVVKIYLTRLGAQGLEKYITVSMESGTGGSFGDCTGFVADAAALPAISLATAASTYSNYATGALPWTTTGASGGESKTYRVTWVFNTTGLDQAAVDALQGTAVSADVVWELQSQ